MFRRLFTLTLLLAGLAAARADAQAPGSPLSPVTPSVSGRIAPLPSWAGAGPVNPGLAGPGFRSSPAADVHVDPRTGIVHAGTLADKWPVPPRYKSPGCDVYVDPQTGIVYVGTPGDKWPLPPGSQDPTLYLRDRYPFLAGGVFGRMASVVPQR